MGIPEGIGSALLKIRGLYPSLRPAERKVADYVLANAAAVVLLSSTELGERTGTSDATVVKFSQRLGFRGYQEFKIALAAEVSGQATAVFGEVERDDDLAVIRDKVFAANLEALNDTRRVLDPAVLEKVVEAILAAPQVCFYGVGASGLVALDAQQKFMRIGLICHAYSDSHLQVTQAALLGRGDVAIGISHSGQTKDTVEVITLARANGAVTVALTNFPRSALATAADYTLLTSTRETAFRSGAIASRLAQLSVIDVLFTAVAVRRFDRSMAFLDRTRRAVAGRRS
ncbi:MAG: MurR/RpiR family transcriptional regulator [Firmicutes bacterium]|nr:MurR/RpiR family transcriptional regulator [Bacillota bacterium]